MAEVLLVGVLALAALLPFVSRLRRRGVVLALVGVSAVLLWGGFEYRAARLDDLQPVTERPIAVEENGYVSSDSCRACHLREYDTWYGSYHRTMTQVAGPDSVAAPFAGQELEHLGQKFRVERHEDEFWVRPLGIGVADPSTHEPRPVQLTTGSHHFQVFWVAAGAGRKLNRFEFCYNIEEDLWMPVDSAFLVPPGVRQTGGTGGGWNERCNLCHATGTQPRVDGAGGADTHVAEFGISCEACHGPAGEHAALNRAPSRRFGFHLSEDEDPTIVNPADLSPVLTSEVCGHCHAVTDFETEKLDRWLWSGNTFRPGDRIADHRRIARHGEQWFWSDGMIRVSGREYNGLTRSPCYEHDDTERVMSCLSCHRMHKDSEPEDARSTAEWANDQLSPGMEGDGACLQCHAKYESDEEVTAHTRHKLGSTGSLCYNCHMPYTTYGLLKAIRSHEVGNPTVQESLLTGRPNACNQCHLDKTLAWTADTLHEWYGTERPELDEDERTVAASVLWTLKGEAGQRALMAWSMGWEPAQEASGTEWMAPLLGQLLVDPYDAVRFIAQRSIRTLPAHELAGYDFRGPRQDRTAAAKRMFEAWEKEDHEVDTAVLFGRELYDRLLDERDNRAMVLAE